MVERVLLGRRAGTQVHDSTVPAGPDLHERRVASSAPVAGSHSIGGTSTGVTVADPEDALAR